MFFSYLKLAFRNIVKYKMYALINILGLAIGLAVFLFGEILLSYEKNHDHMFPKRSQIFTVGSIFAPNSGEPITEYPNVRLAYGPLFQQEIKHLENVVRSIFRQQVISTDNKNFYQGIRFVDSGFTQIFDFNYIHGDETALDDPHGFIITASTAKTLFATTDVLGRKISLDHQYELYVSAVIEDIAADSHFNSSLLPNTKLAAIASLDALISTTNFERLGEWESLYPSDLTYILLPKNRDLAWLQSEVNAVAARHTPKQEAEYISALKVRPLIEANSSVWDSLSFPVFESVRLLGILVLIIACVNYTNLSTAQSFTRIREVGLRTTFGAGRIQLLLQFLIESITLTAFSALLALASIELLVPAYNVWSDKVVSIDHFAILPWLLLLTLFIGLLAGAFPAYSISRFRPIESLRNTFMKSAKGNVFRSLMLILQFAISIFILALVLIIYFQNMKVQSLSSTFPISEVIVLDASGVKNLTQKQAELKKELSLLSGVQVVSFSKSVPFLQVGEWHDMTSVKDDPSRAVQIGMGSIDHEFMALYDIDLLAGRYLEPSNINDVFSQDAETINVVANMLAVKNLGLDQDKPIIGQSFYSLLDKNNQQQQQYKIVGLMQDQYFLGVHMRMRPIVFFLKPQTYSFISVRLNSDDRAQTLKNIDIVWEHSIKDYPIRRATLKSYLDRFFRIPATIIQVIAVFAAVALSLALIGLFGLAVFMAQRRTREIALRKVMGASLSQIVRMLTWQLSLPVIWSLLIAVPSAYLACGVYLDFFPERISLVLPIILLASVTAIITAWIIVAIHAIRIAQATPLKYLQHE